MSTFTKAAKKVEKLLESGKLNGKYKSHRIAIRTIASKRNQNHKYANDLIQRIEKYFSKKFRNQEKQP